MGRWLESAAIRAMDIVIALVMLIFCLPLLVVCSLAVWLGGGRPVLDRQISVGADGRVFARLSFRSSGEAGGEAASRFLAASGLDGLPQLWNVLKGDLSFVGPPCGPAGRPAKASADAPKSGIFQPQPGRRLTPARYLGALLAGIVSLLVASDGY